MVKNTLVAKRMLTDQQIREFLQIEKEPLVWESYKATEMKVLDYIWDDLTLKGLTSVVI